MTELVERGDSLPGVTFKIDLDHIAHPIFVTLNFRDNKPYEIFINSTNATHLEWTSISSRLISAILRKGGDTSFIWKELTELFWIDPFFYKGKQYHSILAVIGEVVEGYLNRRS